MLLSDLQHDFVRTYITPVSSLDPGRLDALIGGDGRPRASTPNWPARASDDARIAHDVALDLRYVKQYHEVTLPIPATPGSTTIRRALSTKSTTGSTATGSRRPISS